MEKLTERDYAVVIAVVKVLNKSLWNIREKNGLQEMVDLVKDLATLPNHNGINILKVLCAHLPTKLEQEGLKSIARMMYLTDLDNPTEEEKKEIFDNVMESIDYLLKKGKENES